MKAAVYLVLMADRVDKDVANSLQGMPVLDALIQLVQKLLMEVADLWNLVKYVFDEGRICKKGPLWPLQRIKIHLGKEKGNSSASKRFCVQ